MTLPLVCRGIVDMIWPTKDKVFLSGTTLNPKKASNKNQSKDQSESLQTCGPAVLEILTYTKPQNKC